MENITVSVLISIPKRHQAVALAVDRGKLCVITSHSNFASRSTARRCDEQILKKNRNDSHRTSFAPCCIFLCSKNIYGNSFLPISSGIPFIATRNSDKLQAILSFRWHLISSIYSVRDKGSYRNRIKQVKESKLAASNPAQRHRLLGPSN